MKYDIYGTLEERHPLILTVLIFPIVIIFLTTLGSLISGVGSTMNTVFFILVSIGIIYFLLHTFRFYKIKRDIIKEEYKSWTIVKHNIFHGTYILSKNNRYIGVTVFYDEEENIFCIEEISISPKTLFSFSDISNKQKTRIIEYSNLKCVI